MSRQKRDFIDLSRKSHAVDYCLGTAGISPGQLAWVVVCSQGEITSEAPHLLLDEQLAIAAYATPFKMIGHHMGHLMSALALSRYQSRAGLVVDGMGSPIRCLPRDERAVCRGDPADDWESISLYEVMDERVRPAEKMAACNGRWLGTPKGQDAYLCPPWRHVSKYSGTGVWRSFKGRLCYGLGSDGTTTTPVEQLFEIEDGQLFIWTAVSTIRAGDTARACERMVRDRNTWKES